MSRKKASCTEMAESESKTHHNFRDQERPSSEFLFSAWKRIVALRRNGYSGPEIQAELGRKGKSISLRSIYRCLDNLGAQEVSEAASDTPGTAEQIALFESEKPICEETSAMERAVGKLVAGGGDRETCRDDRKNPLVVKVASLKRMKTRLKTAL